MLDFQQNIASDARKQREKRIKQILEKRKIPDTGFDDLTIELLVNEIAQLDSNNFISKCGVGEREARIACGKSAINDSKKQLSMKYLYFKIL